MLTLKQLADKISSEYNLTVSKQAVQYHGDKLEIEYHYNNGVKYLDEVQQQLITNRIKEVHLVNVESDTTTNTNVEDKEDTNKNTTNESNNVVEILQSHIDEQRNTIRDLSRMLDQQQQLTQSSNKKIAQLESKIEQYRLEDNSSNVDNRSIKVKRYKVYSPTDESTNEPIDVSDQTDTNIDQATESNKPKGFFAKLFNL